MTQPLPAQSAPASAAQSADAGSDEEMRFARLDALGASLCVKRTEAIQHREASGIEQQWLEDQEFYEGIDDANRREHANAWRTKPPGQADVKAAQTRSTVFVNITGPYCDIAAARFADMVLPTDEANFKIEPPPNPDLLALSRGEVPLALQHQVAAEGDQAQAQLAEATKQASVMVATAKAKAGKAQKRIETWHIQGQWHAEMRRVVEDSARGGSGVLKGPYPEKLKSVAWIDGAVVIDEKIFPKNKRVDCWDLYPDPACGDNIHNGSWIWERDRLTRRQLMDLKGTMLKGEDGEMRPLYIDKQIDRCLEEGPQPPIGNEKKEPNPKNKGSGMKQYEVWYMYGMADRDDLVAAGCDCGTDAIATAPAIITMVNGHVISGAMNPLDKGSFPYDIMPWRRKSGSPWGDGIARQIRVAQRIVNAGVRNMMDNGGLSAGAQIAFKPGTLTPENGRMEITPNKIWLLGEDGDTDDVRKALAFFEIPSMQQELMAIIQFGLKIAEDVTGLPMLLQGQQGTAPDTVGGMTMLNNNASSSTRRIARTFDDCVTEPHIRREYEWLLQYGEDEEKGAFVINARASSALVERDMQNQQIGNLLPLSGNPIYKIDPAKTMTEQLKAWRFDPANFQYDDDKWQKIVEGLAQKPADPRVEVAQLNAKSKADLLQAEQRAEAAEKDKDRQVDLVLKQFDERIAEIKISGAKEITFDEAKAMLAGIAMKLRTQSEISAADLGIDLHKHHNPPPVITPPSEPSGRAQPGQSFQQ